MAVIGIPNLKASGVAEDVTRPKRWRDALLKDVPNDGVRFLFDAAFPWSYPGGDPVTRPAAGNPADGAIIYDMTEHANASVPIPAGAIAYAGGGFDLTNSQVTGGNPTSVSGVALPPSVLADIAAPFAGKAQRWLVVAWLKLPSLANWNNNATLLQILGDRAYNSSQGSLINITLRTGGMINARRQTSANTAEDTNWNLTPKATDYGSVVQLAYWRNDSGQGARLKSTNGTEAITKAVGADNNQDFSGNTFVFGRNVGFSGGGPGVLPSLSGLRLYRGFVENLARSGRDPLTVLDADYAAVTKRAAFS